jgi:uncharacterized membrane protein
MMSKIITAVFKTHAEADVSLRALENAGFTKEQVTMLVSEETRGKHFGIDEKTKAGEGAATGAAIGGLTGALYLGLSTAGALLVPGLNIVVFGTLIGGLVGLGAGAATGGLVGALVGLEIPEHEAKLYEDAVRNGAILIAVKADDAAAVEKVNAILKGTDAQSIKTRAA